MTRGGFRSQILAFALATALVFALCGCRGGDGADEETGHNANPVLAVTVAKVETAPMENHLLLLGTTTALHHVILRAPVAGRVLSINLRIGDTVRKGQVVARVLSHEVEAAQQGLEITKRVDPQDAPAIEQSLKRYGDGAGIAVVAPDSGIVSNQPVTSGQVVNYLDPIVDLIDPASICVEAAVPAGDLHLIRPGMDAAVKSQLEPGTEMPARVAAILPNFNPTGATSPVRLEFTGKQRIREAGAPVEVNLITSSVPDALVVPIAALFQDVGGGYHVFVIGSDGRAHRVPVTLGLRNQSAAQVASGLQQGQLVITSGGYALSDGLRVSAAGAQR